MKLFLVNTAHGLIPYGDEDSDEKRKLELNEIYEADVKVARNLEFHKKYFSMIHCAWDLLPDNLRNGFKREYNFRKYAEITAGYSETFYSPQYGFVEGPTSIAFDKMDQSTFDDLYKAVRTVIDTIVTRYISPEEFEKTLLNY